jgi:DNA-binding NtrC family response regulator
MGRALVRVLFVEDEPLDVELTLMALREAGLEIEHTRVDTADALRQALSTEWDVVISDFEMNGFNGFDALDIVKSKDSDLAFIFVSGVLGEDRAVAAMRAGARDYVLKGKLGRLGVAVEREAVEVASRRRRRQTERALYEQEQR